MFYVLQKALQFPALSDQIRLHIHNRGAKNSKRDSQTHTYIENKLENPWLKKTNTNTNKSTQDKTSETKD